MWESNSSNSFFKSPCGDSMNKRGPFTDGPQLLDI